MNARSESLLNRWRAAWDARDARERTVIVTIVLLLVLASAVWLFGNAQRARSALRSVTLPELRERAGMFEREAAEYERLRAAPAIAQSKAELRALVQAQAGAGGLSRALQSVDAVDADHVKVVIGGAGFGDWLGLLVNLEAQQVRVESCRIEALATPGLVNVTAVLARASRQ